MVAFTALALLISVSTRSGAAGMGVPVLLGFAMQLLGLLDGPRALRAALLTPPFVAWHGLLAAPRYWGPLAQGLITSGVYLVVCVGAAVLVDRHREPGA
jgi:ABC-2 type transport system permease protein